MRLKYQKHKVFSEKFLIIENKNFKFTHAQVLNAYHYVHKFWFAEIKMILVCNGTRIGLNHVQDFLLKKIKLHEG